MCGMIDRHDAYFVDLFVRVSNAVAITMYEKFGYSVYRRVLEYYSGEEDAFGTLNVLSYATVLQSLTCCIPLTATL